MNKESIPYKALCTEFYDLDKPTASTDALESYLRYAEEAKGTILEPMCGTGKFLIPLLEQGYEVMGFDYSPHMLELCRQKCVRLGLTPTLVEGSFEKNPITNTFNLIFIPSSSFCLLTTPSQIANALSFIAKRLNPGGKFVFEIETLWAVDEGQGIWNGKWVDKPDGSKIVLSTLNQFDAQTNIQTVLCRYELWENNAVTRTEVEDFRMRFYEPSEIEYLLQQHGFKVVGKWQIEPYEGFEADESSAFIQYECIKGI